MSYQVLARKLRPASFAALVGQDHVVRALRHALDTNQLHHAYLFTGTRGVGKTTIARILAKSLNCEKGVSSTPCGTCSICLEVAENRFVDLIEVDAASRTRIDDTRELLENAQYLPTRGRYKVYLVDEVHMLSTASFNALLKTLEEPPEHVKFLLATTDPKKVPVTVLSRCLQFQLKNISAARTAEYLAEALANEGVEFDQGALEVISRAARGSMRDALSITDQAIAFGQGRLANADVVEMLGVVGRDEVGAVLDGLVLGDAAALLGVVAELAERAVDFDALLAELLGALHKMAVALATGSPVEAAADNGVDRAGFFTAEVVQLLYQIGLMGYRDLQIAPDPRSGLEMTLLRMLTFAPEGVGQSVPRATADRQAPEPVPPVVGNTPDAAPKAVNSQSNAEQLASAPQPLRADPRGDWHEIVAELALGGVSRMIAEHSILNVREEGRIKLILDRAHDTLLNDSQVRVLSRALSEHLGQDTRVEIEIGETTGETPAERRERIKLERLRAAEEALNTDATVQSLLDEFDGKLDEIHPVDQQSAKK